MILLGVVGWSGSGKTTLVTALLPLLSARGLRVSTIKHAHHGVDLDRPGKDSFRHREAGAEEVMLVSAGRFALMRECPGDAPDLAALAARLAPVDLVLVEGFRSYDFPKIEVWREALGEPRLPAETRQVMAVASDVAVIGGCVVPVLPLNAPVMVADWVADFVIRQRRLGGGT